MVGVGGCREWGGDGKVDVCLFGSRGTADPVDGRCSAGSCICVGGLNVLRSEYQFAWDCAVRAYGHGCERSSQNLATISDLESQT